MKGRSATVVYMALREDGLLKIGSTRSLETRVPGLRASFGMSFEIIRIWTRPASDAHLVEMIAHRLLRKKRVAIGRSRETYAASQKEASAAVARAVFMADSGDLSVLPKSSAYCWKPRSSGYKSLELRLFEARWKAVRKYQKVRQSRYEQIEQERGRRMSREEKNAWKALGGMSDMDEIFRPRVIPS